MSKTRHVINIVLYILIYLIFSLLVLMNLRTNFLGSDDPFTFAIIHHHFNSIIQLTAQDVHPFLYYFLARLFILPFKNLYIQIKALKLLSALPYFIMLIIGNTAIRYHYSDNTSLMFMFALITMPILDSNILTARMYGWTMLITTSIFLLLTYIYRGYIKNSAYIFIIITILTISDYYMQYYALISVFIIEIIFLLLFIHSKFKIKYFFLSIISSVLLYLPWFKIMIRPSQHVSGRSYWSPVFKFTLSTVLGILKGLTINLFDVNSNPNKLIKIFLLLFITLILCVALRNRSHPVLITGFIMPFIIMLVGILINLREHHQVLFPRYLMSTLGIFWFSVSIVITTSFGKSLRTNLLKIVLTLFVLIIGMNSYITSFNGLKPYINSFNKTSNVLKKMPYKSRIICDNPMVMEQMSIYMPHNQIYVIGKHCIFNGKPILIWSNKSHEKAAWGSVYKKVFTNIHDDTHLRGFSKNTYFIKSTTINNIYRSPLANKFYRNEANDLSEVGSFSSPATIFTYPVKIYKIR